MAFRENRLLASLGPSERRLLDPHLELKKIETGKVLYHPGDDVDQTYFPCVDTIVAHVLMGRDGEMTQVATVGAEGAIGGIVSAGHRPAYARLIILVGGLVTKIATDRLELAKRENRRLDDVFSRYADAFLAQITQTVVCNARHSIEQRCCRWLLTMHDRMHGEILVTQETLAEMLGVQRTTISRTAHALKVQGVIEYGRGHVRIVNHAKARALSCYCYESVEAHFRKVLPGLAPSRQD